MYKHIQFFFESNHIRKSSKIKHLLVHSKANAEAANDKPVATNANQ